MREDRAANFLEIFSFSVTGNVSVRRVVDCGKQRETTSENTYLADMLSVDVAGNHILFDLEKGPRTNTKKKNKI